MHLKNLFLGVGLVLFAQAAAAQPFAIDWYKVAGGGGTSTGGVYAVSGTVGQPDAGSMSGGNYALVGGYWSLIAVLPAPGAPVLTITHTSTNTVVVSWPSPSTGFILQQNTNLVTGTWVTAPESVVDDGITRHIVVNPPVGNLYFRLKD